MLKDLVKERVDSIKPRKEGLSYITDRLHAIDADNFRNSLTYDRCCKDLRRDSIISTEEIIQKRIKFYHDHDIFVSTGSTITEYAIMENSFERFVVEARESGL